MSKNLFFFALATAACASVAMGCTKNADDPEPSSSPAIDTPAFDAAASPSDRGAGAIPALHFDDAGAAPEPGDATADVQPIEQDPGAGFGPRVWGTDAQGRLLAFRVNAPAMVSVKAFTGLAAGEKILNVTFRPATGILYGLSSASRIFTVSTMTGAVTPVGDGKAFTPGLMAQASGFDFNPMADKIRVHTDVDQDLRLDPATGKVAAVDGTLSFAPGDVNAGQSPNLVGTGYTNSVSPAPLSTMLYAIDSTRNILTRLPSPNDGMVDTVGELGVDFDSPAGFDISKQGIAYGALHSGAETGLYTVDLGSGVATKVGTIGHPVPLTSIAVE